MKALWVYKCNAGRLGEDGVNYGDWRAFFELARGGRVEWGSTREIKGSSSRKIINEEMRVGDLVLGWQTDRREATGLCRVADITVQAHPDGEVDRVLILDAVEVFEHPVRLHDLKQRDPELAAVGAFGARMVPATLYTTTDDEASVVLDRCGVDPGVLCG